MRIVVVGLILLSLTAAGGTLLLVKQFLEAESQNQTATASVEQAQAPEPTTSVFVLTADTHMPAGTTVKKGHLKWHNWPEDMVTDAFVIRRQRLMIELTFRLKHLMLSFRPKQNI